ncbi:glycosyltransferase family 39 protein [Flavisolibacter sp. BT320]|nr:glycosyltransferase family 39 protein [Flavisolibacter longurius]
MKKETLVLCFLLLLKFLLPFLLSHPVYELHRDEYLYYEQGQHLSLGYLENPPLIGVLAAISSFFGGGYFWVKFWPSLFGVLTLWITLKMVREWGGSFYAQVLAALGLIVTAYLRIHFLFQPNFLEIFFWTLASWYLLRYLKTENSRYLFLLAISLAFGWYSKYSVLFLIAALFIGILLTHHRRILVSKTFWLAVLTGAGLVAPNVLWQYYHNWPLFHHMQELQETQLQHLNRLDFIKEQVLFLLPVAFLWIGGLCWTFKQKTYRLMAWCFVFILLLIMMGSGKGYYTLGAYPMMLAAGAVWAESVSQQKKTLRIAFTAIILLLSLPFIPLLLPLQKPADMAASNQKFGVGKLGVLRWEDGQDHPLQQDFADMLGWKELAEKAEAFYQQQPDSAKASILIYCASYGLAGGMKYYAKDPNFRNKIISENGTFLLWAPDRLYFKHLVFIDDEMPKANDNVLKRFSSTTIVDSCTNPYSRQFGAKIFHFQNATDSAWIIASKDIQEAKRKFSR